MTQTWEQLFDEQFETQFEEEVELKNAILTKVDFNEMKQCLQNQVSAIRAHRFTRQEWGEFRQELVTFSPGSSFDSVVVWDAPSIGKPYVKFDYRWNLIDTPQKVYVCFAAIHGTFVRMPKFEETVEDIVQAAVSED